MPVETRIGHEILRTGVRDGGCFDLNPGPLEELLTAEKSPLVFHLIF